MRGRITGPDVGDDEIKLLYPVLRDVPRLRYIELYATSVSQDGLTAIKQDFPDYALKVHDQWF